MNLVMPGKSPGPSLICGACPGKMARLHFAAMTMRFTIFLLITSAALLGSASAAKLGWLEQIPLESYGKMREVERYQLKIAEKHYIGEEYKIALDEYEKFLALYESSAGAPYAQLMWSHCQAKLRKVNTAIRDGFQSVVDYWPKSEEAVMAAFLIGRSYQEIGEVEKAKAAYSQLMEAYPDQHVTILAKVNLLEMARTAQDDEARLQILEELTYKTTRTEAALEHCQRASRELCGFYFGNGDWANALKALQTSYRDGPLDQYAYESAIGAVRALNREEDSKPKAEKLGADLIAFLDKNIPTDLGEDQNANRQRAWNNLTRIAGVHATVGRQPQVIQTYDRIGKVLGKSDALLGQIAGYYRSITERDKAKATYAKYENAVEGRRQIAYMLREDGKWDEAIAMYRGLIDEDPDRVNDYLWAIAECYESKGDFKTAIANYRQVDRWPSNYFKMAHCHRRLKEYKEALVLYNGAKADQKSAPEAAIQMGYTYEEAGQKENAIKTFQLTCRAHPKSGQASRAHAHLQNKYQINVTLGGAKDE